MADRPVPIRYRKKPVVIEAMGPLTDDIVDDVTAWVTAGESAARGLHERDSGAGAGVMISTLEGRMHAALGDYVIRGVQGEFYPCKPDIFMATYEPVEEELRTSALDRANALLAEIRDNPTAYVQKVRGRRRAARRTAS